MNLNRDLIWLQYMLECLAHVEGYIAAGEQEFMRSPLIQDAVLRRLQVIGDISERLRGGLTSMQPGIEWDHLRGLRNVIVHEPLNIDIGALWEVASIDLPRLKQAVLEMLERA